MGILINRNLRDCGTLDHVDRIAFGGEHHAKGGVLVIPSELRGFAVKNGIDAGTEVGSEFRQHHFGFRIAEAGVELDDLRTVGSGDQTRIQNAGERCAFVGHGFDGRFDDGLNGGVDHILADLRHRAVGAHAAGVRALVLVVGALVILRNRHRPEVGAVHEAHQREFLSFEEVFDNHFGTGVTETVIDENIFQSGNGGFLIHRNGHAFARSQTVSLDHDRGTMFAHVGCGTVQVVEGLILCGRNVVTFHKLLGEILGALDLGGGLIRAERLDAGCGEIVDDAFDQRHFRTDEYPVVVVVLHEFDQRGMVGRIELRSADAVQFHARIARGHGDLADTAATHQRVRDGVLARAGTDNQNLHISSYHCPRRGVATK